MSGAEEFAIELMRNLMLLVTLVALWVCLVFVAYGFWYWKEYRRVRRIMGCDWEVGDR